MREQSHKAEMAQALRGDFARLRARGIATTLAPDEPEALPEPVPEDLPAASSPPVVAVELPSASPPTPMPGSEEGTAAPVPVPDAGRIAAPGWLDRVLGRR